jgi:parafibromin
VPDKDDQEKVKKMALIVEGAPYGFVVGPNEKKYEKSGAVYHNRETVLRGERINVRLLSALVPPRVPLTRPDIAQNFESVISLVAPRLKQMKEDQQRKQPSSAQTATPAAPAARPQKKKQLNPIIMISPSSTALITMHNVKQFLEEARSACLLLRATRRTAATDSLSLTRSFIPSEEARRLASGGNVSGYIAEDVVQVNHARASASGANTAATRPARYFVVDSVEALSKFGGAGKLDEAWCAPFASSRRFSEAKTVLQRRAGIE